METPIRVLIADDNADMRRIERMMISRAEGFEIVGEAEDGVQLLTLVEQEKPQLVFLDVEMPGKTGVECARVIQDMNPAIVLIFATAHDEYMGDAFEVYAFDYLLKPFKKERVMQTLERAKKRIRHQTDGETPLPVHPTPHPVSGRLMLHHKDGVSFLNVSDIVLVQREDRTTVFYTASGERYVTSDSLSDTEARLDPSIFFRCHKSSTTSKTSPPMGAGRTLSTCRGRSRTRSSRTKSTRNWRKCSPDLLDKIGALCYHRNAVRRN